MKYKRKDAWNYWQDFKKCIFVMRIGWKQHFSYKIHLLVSLISGCIPLISIYYLWKAIYWHNPSQLNDYYSFSEMITYALSVFLLYSTISTFGLEWEIAGNIHSGHLTRYLLYPFGVIKYFFSWLTSEKIFTFFIRMPLIILIYFCISHIVILPSFSSVIFFLLGSLMAYIIYFFISFIVGLSAFWWGDVTGLFYLENTVISLCSGLFLPINLLPSSLIFLIKCTPFYYILYFPIQIFIQKITSYEIIFYFAVQLIWVGILYLLASIILKIGLKKYEAAGG